MRGGIDVGCSPNSGNSWGPEGTMSKVMRKDTRQDAISPGVVVVTGVKLDLNDQAALNR